MTTTAPHDLSKLRIERKARPAARSALRRRLGPVLFLAILAGLGYGAWRAWRSFSPEAFAGAAVVSASAPRAFETPSASGYVSARTRLRSLPVRMLSTPLARQRSRRTILAYPALPALRSRRPRATGRLVAEVEVGRWPMRPESLASASFVENLRSGLRRPGSPCRASEVSRGRRPCSSWAHERRSVRTGAHRARRRRVPLSNLAVLG